MDTVTQMLFGGVVAQAGFRHRLGRRAIVAGAAVALIPDLDIVVQWAARPVEYWRHHRGLTHSLVFGPVVGPFLGYAFWRLDRRARPYDPAGSPERLRSWIWLAILALLTHPLIDLFTSYGTQLLCPLSDTRFAIKALPIIDPVYSVALLVALIIGAFSREDARRAETAAACALFFIGLYSLAGWAINARVLAVARAEVGRGAQINAYPLLFQPYFRRIVAWTPAEVQVGYYSVLAPEETDWTTYPVEDDTPLVDAVQETRAGKVFEWFAMGQALWSSIPSAGGETEVRAYDLRYGMKGMEPSLWGLRALVAADGRIIEGPEPFMTRRGADRAALRGYWHDITGF